jgi:glucan biosynthesis protein
VQINAGIPVTLDSLQNWGPAGVALIHVPIEEENEDRWCLWRPDHAGFDSRSIFEGALVEK